MIRLGKLTLNYCYDCNLPLLKSRCSCGNLAEKVKITPPGDIRPAFEFDINLLKKVIERQYGSYYLPHVVLLNNLPSIDKNDEVIIDGKVAGNIFYDIWNKTYKFQPRPWYASLLKIKRGYVVADKGAIPSILKSSNLMAPGVKEVDEEIRAEDEVIVLDEDGLPVATGKAKIDGNKMKNSRGVAVRIRWRKSKEEYERGNRENKNKNKNEKRKIRWNEVIEANRDVIFSMVGNEVKFIEEIIKKYSYTPVISFSGGKDSLATLLLLLDAGYELPIIFANTGLEFDETIEHVYEIADKYASDFFEGKAGNIFWESIDFFGPPARDYRWCCKTCKLGVIAKLIKKNFPKGVLSFIGQRRYESERRAEHGKIWKNPWVHGQIAASPIQNWTALHVWLYLFIKKVKWNILYEKGFYRIGCWLCPACDLAEFELKKHKKWDEFYRKLCDFSRKHDLPSEWIDLGLWRWRNPPKWSNIKYDIRERREYKIEGNEKRIENFLKILGKVRKIGKYEYEINGSKIRIDKEIKSDLIKDLIYRAIYCVGCGVCYAKCDAIYIENGKAWISDACNHCLKCMDECPVIIFR